MKKQKYIVIKLVLLIVIIASCKSYNTKKTEISIKESKQMIITDGIMKVEGIARNDKGGAIIINDYGVFRVIGIGAWDESFLNKKTCVWGEVNFFEASERDTITFSNSELGRIRPQMYSKYYEIANATWELCNDIIQNDTIK